jgi:tRNA G18 (ribose-2'-O)-methylase SpoU
MEGTPRVARFSPEEIEQFWRQQNPRRRALREALHARRLPYAVAVENLSKDWNIGNLIRTANAYLCGELILIGQDTFDDAGCPGIYRFERMRHVPDGPAFERLVRDTGYETVAVEIDRRAELLPSFTYPERPLFLFGSELEGLSPERVERAAHRIMIPQYGLIPCLNVNVSCSIVLYDYVTRTFPDLAPAPIAGAKFQLEGGSGRSSPREGRISGRE